VFIAGGDAAVKKGGPGVRGLRPPSRVRAIDSPSMCAGLHQYAPASAKLGGGVSGLFLPLKDDLSGDLWET